MKEGFRPGDSAAMAAIEFVDRAVEPKGKGSRREEGGDRGLTSARSALAKNSNDRRVRFPRRAGTFRP
jgi:hypothetical protein